MTDALQQRSRYKCALKNAPLGEFLLFAVFKTTKIEVAAEKSLPVRSDEECSFTMHGESLPFTVFKTT